MLLVDEPIEFSKVMNATETSAAMRAYSITVAPDLFRSKARQINRTMIGSLHLLVPLPESVAWPG